MDVLPGLQLAATIGGFVCIALIVWVSTRARPKGEFLYSSKVTADGIGSSREESLLCADSMTDEEKDRILVTLARWYPRWAAGIFLHGLIKVGVTRPSRVIRRFEWRLPVLGTPVLVFEEEQTPMTDVKGRVRSSTSSFRYRVAGGIAASNPPTGYLSFAIEEGADGSSRLVTRLEEYRPALVGTKDAFMFVIRRKIYRYTQMYLHTVCLRAFHAACHFRLSRGEKDDRADSTGQRKQHIMRNE